MSRQLEGKSAVITGSGSGIGRATALLMAARGARVTVSDVDDANGEETVRQVREAGGEATYAHCDVTDGEQVLALMRHAAETHGGIDVLHNNAGIHDTAIAGDTSSETISEEAFDRVFDINVKGTWRCARAALPYLREAPQGSGTVINSASVVSFVAFPMGPAYCASKGAIMQLTKSMATDWAKFGIRVNAYAPGVIETAMVSKYWETAEDQAAVKRELASTSLIPRLGQAEDVAAMVCFLASDDAEFLTGGIYLVDGGMLAWRGANEV
ncbi:SDR family NAD(P)-dependent oxidoreductase [Conexibacter sp. CPCC 206217]|uniref:SDR family NAD(P)-dependent oxidoreductase n=1 Tax=Conexibacter sp. CPCC 206217 TaxID=3064574 RepID=UPI00271785C9|nr:SDR family oxidoreductase [Conexibacter sp. CPCC 206217]MDO8211657.1 SDR family oxidoreductase [Conexibacter sp. CPCC 206217]